MPLQQWVSRYPTHRHKSLVTEYDKIVKHGFAADSLVTNFVKFEAANKPTDPRNISSRADGFMALMGTHTSRLEHHLRKAPFVTKGLNFKQRDAKMSKLCTYSNFLELDFERFDMTISPYILNQLEAALLVLPFDNPHAAYIKAIMGLNQVRGFSREGTAYKVHGTRCSGDTTTSLANTCTNYFVTWLCMEFAKREGVIKSWTSFHEGDDGVIAYEGEDPTPYFVIAQHLGFRAKVELRARLEDVTFCGRRMTAIDGQFRSYCDIPRTLGKLHVTCNAGRLDYLLLAKAIAYYSNDSHTPLVGAWAYYITKLMWPKFNNLKPARVSRILKSMHPYYRTKLRTFNPDLLSLSIDEGLRPVVAETFGISIAIQHEYEAYFESWWREGRMTIVPLIPVDPMRVSNYHLLGLPFAA